ncbi:MAG: hypothetical protein FJW38_07075 [Acidobacteria bacterium]|nr:hypothetical protein [Acidobacteriota bacterium]
MSWRKRVAFGLILSGVMTAAILPEGIERHSRGAVTPLAPEPAAVWKEYGLQEAEKAAYKGAKGTFSVSAWRVADATAAQAAFQLLRPENSAPSTASKMAAKFGGALLVAMGNYVLQFDGFAPEEETLNQLILHMPRYDFSSLPALTGFLPADGKIANSERFIVGPSSLEAFAPGLAPSLVAFHYGAEGQLARYRVQGEEVSLLLLNYPSPQIAREREAAFAADRKDLIVKRTGPLLGVVLKSASPDAAERVLAPLRWEANITVNQQMPDPKGDNIGVLVINVAKFSGMMFVFCLLAGFGFAFLRRARGKIFGQKGADPGEVIGLNLEEHSGK